MWRFRQILVAFSEYTNSIKESKGDTPTSPRSILFSGNGRVSLIVMSRPHPSGLVNVLHNSEKKCREHNRPVNLHPLFYFFAHDCTLLMFTDTRQIN